MSINADAWASGRTLQDSSGCPRLEVTMPGPVGKTTVNHKQEFSSVKLDDLHYKPSLDEHQPTKFPIPGGLGGHHPPPNVEILKKAAHLQSWIGEPTSGIEPIGQGYVRHFAGGEIYYLPGIGAFEVHGDILAKYKALGGPTGILGFPSTDETGTPDSIGRFNHFQGGSIYWTPDTGPMMVHGAIRDKWATLGWENSTLGYPVADQHRFITRNPTTDPVIMWTVFQNGAIFSSPDGTDTAVVAEVSPDQMRALVRRKFDEAFHKSPNNIGLQPNAEILAVTDWGYGFWASRPRLITFRLHGFRDNGLLPDTDFELDAQLLFTTTWQPGITDPTEKTIVAELGALTVSAHGLSSDEVANGVLGGVQEEFKQPQEVAHLPVGKTPDIIGILVTGNGGLQVLLNPLPEGVGPIRQSEALKKIDDLVNGR